jgi:hypothetical protein
MNNEDFPALSRNQDSESSSDRNTTTSSSSSESTWITTQGILEGISSPATPGRSNSELYSQLDNLRRGNRKLQRARPLTPIPTGETTTGNSETSTSVNTSSNEDQDATREQVDVQSSALSGYSPGKSSDNSDSSSIGTFNRNSPPRESSEEGSPNTPIDDERNNDNSPNPSNDNDEDNEEESEISTPSPSITTGVFRVVLGAISYYARYLATRKILLKLFRIESHHHDNGNVSNQTSMDTGLLNINLLDEI